MSLLAYSFKIGVIWVFFSCFLLRSSLCSETNTTNLAVIKFREYLRIHTAFPKPDYGKLKGTS